MGNNLQQAPELIANGAKNQDLVGWGKAIRTHELEAAIANCLGERDFVAYKVMMFYTGNAEGFRVAEKTICERCNISDRAYKTARKKLADKGWITDVKGVSITINYEKIYKDFWDLVDKQEGSTVKPSSAARDELTSPHKEDGMNSIHPEGMNSLHPMGGTYITPTGGTQFTHNNINNNININNIKNNNSVEQSSTGGRDASVAPASSKDKDKEDEARHEAYRKEMIALNDKFFDGVQAYKAKFGDDYSNHTEYIVWREGITAETEALKKKYNIGQKQ